MSWLVSVLFVVTFCLDATTSEIAVVHPPQDTVAYPGEDATFTCDVGDAPDVTWKVNGTYIAFLPSELQDDIEEDKSNYTLTIKAKPEYNTTKVQCVAIGDGSERVDSEEACLIIIEPSDSSLSPTAPTDTPTEGTDIGSTDPTTVNSPPSDPTSVPTNGTDEPGDSNPTNSTSDRTTLSDGALAGIVVAAVLGVIGVIRVIHFLVVCVVRIWKRQRTLKLHVTYPQFSKANQTQTQPTQTQTTGPQSPAVEGVPGTTVNTVDQASSLSPHDSSAVHRVKDPSASAEQISGTWHRRIAPSSAPDRLNDVDSRVEMKELTVPPKDMPANSSPSTDVRASPSLTLSTPTTPCKETNTAGAERAMVSTFPTLPTGQEKTEAVFQR